MKRIYVQAFIAAWLVLGSACAATKPVVPATAAKLTAADFNKTIVGSTLSGTTSKQHSWAEYYLADGTIKGLWDGNHRYPGGWKLDGDKVCFQYPEAPSYNSCYILAVQGDHVWYLDESGAATGAGATLHPGNSNNL